MTIDIDSAIDILRDNMGIADGEGAYEAFNMAIAALRDQQEAEKNELLTLDELQKMDGQAVWLNNSPFGCRCFIVNNKFAFRRGIVACGIDLWGQATELSLLVEIGLYRHPPCANSIPAVL